MRRCNGRFILSALLYRLCTFLHFSVSLIRKLLIAMKISNFSFGPDDRFEQFHEVDLFFSLNIFISLSIILILGFVHKI